MNINDKQWEKLTLAIEKFYLIGPKSRNNRLFIEAVFWVVLYRRGWSRLPVEFGQWRTNYIRFRRWNESGLWRTLARTEIDDQELMSKLEIVANWGEAYLNHIAEQKKELVHEIIFDNL